MQLAATRRTAPSTCGNRCRAATSSFSARREPIESSKSTQATSVLNAYVRFPRKKLARRVQMTSIASVMTPLERETASSTQSGIAPGSAGDSFGASPLVSGWLRPMKGFRTSNTQTVAAMRLKQAPSRTDP